MTIDSQNNNERDDQVLAQLYKKSAKETPPAKLNSEIINYAANANKKNGNSDLGNNHVGSHFGGGWKVPLSLAASVVVVFALLVQIDQRPKQLELPPIPEVSIPSKSKSIENDTAKEALTNEPLLKRDSKPLDLDTQDAEEPDLDESRTKEVIEQEAAPSNIQTQPTADNKAEQKQQIYRERTDDENLLEKNTPSDDTRVQHEMRSNEAGAAKLHKPSVAKKQQEDVQIESPQENTQESQESSEIGASSALSDTTEDFAAIPVEDWLLMIEKLIAQKDYAEAARQLQKFKQAHPKVNVEELDAKIP